ncbi:MAG: D-glutamate cyclase family protein, partial [Gammaproteobacteria bacterium]
FWACGVTPQLALHAAAPDIAITHEPGKMFITDLCGH